MRTALSAHVGLTPPGNPGPALPLREHFRGFHILRPIRGSNHLPKYVKSTALPTELMWDEQMKINLYGGHIKIFVIDIYIKNPLS